MTETDIKAAIEKHNIRAARCYYLDNGYLFSEELYEFPTDVGFEGLLFNMLDDDMVITDMDKDVELPNCMHSKKHGYDLIYTWYNN